MHLFKHVSHRWLLLVLLISFVPFMAGCDMARNLQKPDRDAGLETQDFKDALAQRPPAPADAAAPVSADASIPSLQPYIAAAAPDQNAKAMPLVSVSVNQSVPLRDILFELAQQADYDLELDPRIQGSIIFTARDRPFNEVIQRIAEIGGLRYKFDNDVLRVELDTPYNKTYKIDYLSYIRSNKGSVKNNISVVSGEGADTGSAFEASSESEADFWGELEVNLQQMLGSTQSAALRTKIDPAVTSVPQPENNVQPLAATDAQGNPVAGTVNVQPAAVINVQPVPTTGASNPESYDAAKASFAINRQGGIVNVYANDRAQGEVDKYLKLLRKSVTAQVLIEAKILEVTLNDEYSTGIDWRLISGDFPLNFMSTGGAGSALLQNLSGSTSPGPAGTTLGQNSNFVIGYGSNDVQAVIQAISAFGSVRALASPRLTVLNNQSAVLNVANNRVYFDVDIDVTTQNDVSQVNVDSNVHNVPEGVLVNVQPSINLDNNTISMAVRPTVTRIVAQRPDPAVQYITAANNVEGVVSLVPELNVQEIDSVIQVNSGQPVVMGGLLQDRIGTNQQGVPILGDVPVAGALFRKHNDLVSKTELVIFLKATILEAPSDTVHGTDKDLYRTFSGDRRPFKL